MFSGAFPRSDESEKNAFGRDEDRILVERVRVGFAIRVGFAAIFSGLNRWFKITVVAPTLFIPTHTVGDFIESIGSAFELFVETDITDDDLVLLAEVVLPIELVPS